MIRSRITDSGSLFHFSHNRRLWHFKISISISHIVASRFLRNSAKWLTPTREWLNYILGAIRLRPGSGSIWSLLVEATRIMGTWLWWSYALSECCIAFKNTRISAVAERPRDASCLSVVNFNSTIPRAQSFIISYFGFRFFFNAYN